MKLLSVIFSVMVCGSVLGQLPIKTVIVTKPDTITASPSGGTIAVGQGVRYYTPNLGVDTMKFTSVQPATLDQVSITFQTLAATDTVYLDWGDGSAVVKISNVTDQIVTSNYTTNNTTYNIKLYGDLSKVKKFYVYEATVASLNINDISDYMINLGYLYLRDVTATGNKAFSSSLTYLFLVGNNIKWGYTGTFSDDMTNLQLYGTQISWASASALPSNLVHLNLTGVYINWTGLDIGDNGNLTELTLANYRIAKMTSADMVTLLTQLTNRTGTLPATITISDYADAASPPQAVTDAVAALKTAKSITSVVLGQ